MTTTPRLSSLQRTTLAIVDNAHDDGGRVAQFHDGDICRRAVRQLVKRGVVKVTDRGTDLCGRYVKASRVASVRQAAAR